MAVPFSIPDEQNDSDIILTQRLLDLYQLLYEILLQRQPLTPLDDTLQSVVNEQTENEVVTTLETPFVEYDVQTQVKKKKVNRRRFKTEEIVVPDAPVVPEQRSICPDWIGVGRNLRKIADNFHNSKPCNEPEVPEYFTTQNTDLLTTIVSLSPFRDSLWSAVFVVGYRILSNNAR
ncbi:uncharacterized protein LOC123302529 [Chrysoperla carnea]|uniref:uncharacterized protein LOC123302529 n=1 Tax=Chrysoperla carnea TaxID=189513 RepID=UPI001D0654CF|nr:uncharacterized protein LOC123302529 [Chrysoperla carnea]